VAAHPSPASRRPTVPSPVPGLPRGLARSAAHMTRASPGGLDPSSPRSTARNSSLPAFCAWTMPEGTTGARAVDAASKAKRNALFTWSRPLRGVENSERPENVAWWLVTTTWSTVGDDDQPAKAGPDTFHFLQTTGQCKWSGIREAVGAATLAAHLREPVRNRGAGSDRRVKKPNISKHCSVACCRAAAMSQFRLSCGRCGRSRPTGATQSR